MFTKKISNMIKAKATAQPGGTAASPRKRGFARLVGDALLKSNLAGKAIGAKKGGMIKKKAASDMAGRALKRKTADAKGRAMKKGK